MNIDTLNRIYAGWLGKIIGVRYGAPIEGLTFDDIRQKYGILSGYPVDYNEFAADDDTNGPMFFLRSLSDYGMDATEEQIGKTWLNYAPYEHGFYWWGGYGMSTEHTAYMNLKAGVPAPHSGSAALNGLTVAEQIGGQIFIDTWGLIAPNDPARAASYAKKAASVSHDRNGIYGGMFIAACIAAAFNAQSVMDIIEAGLAQIPSDCEYTRMCRAVIDFRQTSNDDDWEKCFFFVRDNFGYDKYPGNCHIIPNAAVIILSMLYSGGSFDQSMNICNMCGWDTDCNAGNLGTIMGVFVGIDGIDYEKWRKPINDFYCASSVVGSLNIMDIPSDVKYIASLAEDIIPPVKFMEPFDFVLKGSTHGFKARSLDATSPAPVTEPIENALRSLSDSDMYLYHRTYYSSKDFHDSRYDPAFSPLVYNGQTIAASLRKLAPTRTIEAAIYVRDHHDGQVYHGSFKELTDETLTFTYTIDAPKDICIDEVGLIIRGENPDIALSRFEWYGQPDYAIDISKEYMDVWSWGHKEISQFTYFKGYYGLEDYNDEQVLSLSCADLAEMYTGSHAFTNYSISVELIPQFGDYHSINARVQGAMRSYAAGLRRGIDGKGKIVIEKNDFGYITLAEADFEWQHGERYPVEIEVTGSLISVSVNGNSVLQATDSESPLLHGQCGISVRNGSHCHYRAFRLTGRD